MKKKNSKLKLILIIILVIFGITSIAYFLFNAVMREALTYLRPVSLPSKEDLQAAGLLLMMRVGEL